MINLRRSRKREGLTIVELLIAGFVLVVVLGAAATFLAQQTQLQRSVQSRNELQDRVRVSMQYITQDLALTGNPILISANGTQIEPSPFLGCPGVPQRCLELVDVSDTSSIVRMRYLSSQFATADSCRDVAYRLNDGVLERADVPCVADAWGNPDAAWVPIAPSALGFKMVVVCSDGTRYEAVPDGACSAPDGYARSAIVSVAAESVPANGTDSGTSWSVVGLTNRRACAVGRLCFGATAEVLLPNLKE